MIKFDDFDFHAGEAVARGRSEDDAFTHIGFMLSWLARHGLVSRSTFPKSVVRQIEAGSLRPNDLRDLVDGKLVSSMLSAEGSSFLQRYYPDYLDDWALEFADHPLYGVPDDAIHEARIDRRIDAAYQRWIGEGRPETPGPRRLPPRPGLAGSASDVPELRELLESGHIRQADSFGSRHLDLELERRIKGAVGRSLTTESADGQGWGAGFHRALRNLKRSKASVVVVTALEQRPGGVSVEVDSLPDVDHGDLAAHFGPILENRIRGRWSDVDLNGVAGRSSVTPTGGPLGKWSLHWFALNGFVVYIAGPDPEVIRDISLALISELRT